MKWWSVAVALAALVAHAARAEDDGHDGWQFEFLREEIRPWRNTTGSPERLLCLTGRGDANVDGKWVKRVPVAGGKFYAYSAEYRALNVETPLRSVLGSVLWFDSKGKQLGPAEFPLTRPASDPQGWATLVGTYQAPPEASAAQIEVRLRWAAKGSVQFRRVTLTATAPPSPRKVKIASVNHRPRRTGSPRENLDQFARFVDEAAAAGADVVCLPEGITVCGTNKSYVDVAEAVPGPSTDFLGGLAAKHKLYLVAGIYERDGASVYNTSVLVGRDGNLVGKYRKVCLPREEIDGGITPGTDYPVFDTDFGRVGMMICWDVSYPEVARELAARGAEVIFLPIWGGNETLARARAIENQVHLVASGYDFRTAIYDKAGEELARSPDTSGVVYAEVDLNERKLWPWLGDWRSRIWREAPPRRAGTTDAATVIGPSK